MEYGIPHFLSFHSIGFHSEWGESIHRSRRTNGTCYRDVSIQLISPARGEMTPIAGSTSQLRFHSIGFPCEGGVQDLRHFETFVKVSIQLVSPARGENRYSPRLAVMTSKFPFN